jgi:hypothetical protein
MVVPEKTESGRWRRLELEMTEHAFRHAAAILRSVAENMLDEQLRERLLKAAQRLEDDSYRTRLG